MRRTKTFALTAVLFGSLAGLPWTDVRAAQSSPAVAVGPQYDSTHVYVVPDDFDRFVASFIATFGGTASKAGAFTVTPTPSLTMSQIVTDPGRHFVGLRLQDADPLSLWHGADRLSRHRHGQGRSRRARQWRRCPGRDVSRPDRPRRHHSMAGRRGHAALLAYERAELRGASDRAREPGLPVAGPGRSVHPRFRRLLAWQNRL